ncbi:MAG: family peptide maturation system protein [Firmicutes bacterium]|nr:family peptide maturation system protein [Bacillota bacterium]
MNQTTLLPVDIESMPIIRFSNNLVDDLNITSAVSLKGWGIKSIDSIDYKSTLTSIELINSLKYMEMKNLILNKPSRFCDFTQHIFPYIKENREQIEKIYSCWTSVHNILEEFSKNNDIEYIPLKYNMEDPTVLSYELSRIRTPIIFSASLEERSDKFSTQMALYNYFSKKGYNVQMVGTKQYGELLGVINFPQFMFEKKYSNTEKILKFNQFIKNIEINTVPDLFIIGIPGSVGPFIDNISTHFDDMAYLISNAVAADITVINTLCTPMPPANEVFLQLQYKYGWVIDDVVINCFLLDYSLSKTLKKKEYIKICPEYIHKFVNKANENYNEDMFFSYDNVNKLCTIIESKLVDYGTSNLI